MKPLNDALHQEDNIYAVIKGSSVNHGGRTHGYTVPNPVAQGELIEQALEKSGVDAASISYMEAHGTGTDLGDPIEIRGLMKAFEKYGKGKHYCAIGSVKSNIGHLESAAGIAALTKVLLQIKHKQLVPSLHSDKLNPKIDFANSVFKIQRELSEWKRPVLHQEETQKEYPLRAGISSFGAGGSNAHVIVEEYQSGDSFVPAQNMDIGKPYYLIGLSAKHTKALNKKIEQLSQWLEYGTIDNEHQDGYSLQAISYTLNIGRDHFTKRCCMVVSSVDELKQILQKIKQGTKADNYLYSDDDEVKQSEQAIYNKVFEGLLKDLHDFDYSQAKQYRDNLFALAGLYVKGYNIDWQLLHQDESCKRISLPTYPFEKNAIGYQRLINFLIFIVMIK